MRTMSRTTWATAVITCAALGGGVSSLRAGGPAPSRTEDWPQLWGPKGDARSLGTAAFARATALRGRELWRRPIGSGFSGITVVAGRAYTGLSDGTHDHAVAFDPATGREAWRTKLGETYRGHDGSKDGPISTPAVDEGRVFLVGPHGLLVGLDAKTGRELWRHHLKTEYGAPAPAYGFGTSPVVVGPRLVVQAGGEKAHNLLAFDKATGKLAWSVQHTNTTGYGTPAVGTIGGVPQILVLAADKVFAVKPEDGALLWSHTLPNSEPSRPPLVLPDGRVLVPSWTETALLQVSAKDGAFTVAEVWRTPRLKNSYSPTVFHNGHLYGYNGSYLLCVDPANAEVKWRQKVYHGSLILVDGHLVLLGESSGDLRVAEAKPEGYREKLKMPIFNAGASSFTGPTWAGGRLYLRNVEEMVGLEISG
jgi:outer membrane protein assembly factor BamB